MAGARLDVLLDFVRRNFAAEDGTEITPDTPLLSTQILDSMGITVLAAFIEETFAVPFDGSELRTGRLESVRHIAQLLDRL
jgi:acyl carrier protein